MPSATLGARPRPRPQRAILTRKLSKLGYLGREVDWTGLLYCLVSSRKINRKLLIELDF